MRLGFLKYYISRTPFGRLRSKKGMEVVQVAILIGIGLAVALVFKDKINDFVENVFDKLNEGDIYE